MKYRIKYTGTQSTRAAIPDEPYRMLIAAGSGSGKTNVLLNLINHQPVLYAKDPYHSKYQFLIKERQEVRQKHFNSKVLIEYSNDITVK